MIQKTDILTEDIELIQDSGYFDADYYFENYKEELDKDEDPLEHFLSKGWQESKNPSEEFNVSDYLKMYPEVQEADKNPLLHYLHEGKDKDYFPSKFAEQLEFGRKQDHITYPAEQEEKDLRTFKRHVDGIADHVIQEEKDSHAFEGHVDGIVDNVITGWVYSPESPKERLSISVFWDGAPIAKGIANLKRSDLEEAGIGDGHCSFRIEINHNFIELAKEEKNVKFVVYAQLEDAPKKHLGFVNPFDKFTLKSFPQQFIDSNILPHVTMFSRLVNKLPKKQLQDDINRATIHKGIRCYEQLFEPINIEDQAKSPQYSQRPKLSKYLLYTYRRMKADKKFKLSLNASETDHFLRWYIESYISVRRELRAPLSKEEIAYLNEPISFLGYRQLISRTTLTYLLGNQNLCQRIDFSNDNFYRELVYWWSIEQAKKLSVEDCLVPNYYIDYLRFIPMEWKDKELPLSLFVETFFNKNVHLHSVNLRTTIGRVATYFHIFLLALTRPDVLRYIPNQVSDYFFTENDSGSTIFDSLITSFITEASLQPDSAEESPYVLLNSQNYARALLNKGFDLKKRAFTSIDSKGHRLGSVKRSSDIKEEFCDVQVIGPFEKASGLGQACRLTGETFNATKYSTNFVDFGLDNPAPEGYSKDVDLGEFKRAKVNLIHLNAESIPLAYAYLPDVFTGSYNIGYFFWELDSPALCHYLSLDLLDEIWVSTKYGVDTYKPHTEKPVINVGMAYEDIGDIDIEEARNFVESSYNIDSNTFIFVGTFDSFSFVQRKNPLGLIQAFQKAFQKAFQNDDVKLLIKTQNRDFVLDPVQQTIWQSIYEIANDDPRIQIINETMSYKELLLFKKGCDCYVSLHRSEGWGFGIIEAMNLGIPVICTGYSGNMEFCDEESVWLVDYDLVLLGENDYIFVNPGQKWAEPRLESAVQCLKAVYKNKEEREAKVNNAQTKVQANFSLESIAKRYESRLDAILK